MNVALQCSQPTDLNNEYTKPNNVASQFKGLQTKPKSWLYVPKPEVNKVD